MTINPRMRPALLLLLSPLLSAQTVVSDYFIFKGTIYEQTSSNAPTILANPMPHAPGPYYIDVGVLGSEVTSPSFTKPGDATILPLQQTNATRWDFKAGYSSQAALDGAYPNQPGYLLTIPGYNGGTAISLTLPGNPYPSLTVAAVENLGPGMFWSGGELYVNPAVATTLNLTAFAEYSTSISGLEFRQRLAIVPPSGSDFGLLANSAFNDPAFTEYELDANPLTLGTRYRVVLEYDVLTTYDESGDALGAVIYSNQTQFFMTAIPEPSTYALLAGVAVLAGAIHRRRRRTS